MKYKNAQLAFEHLYTSINDNGILIDNTKVFYNQGFYILNPLDNKINTDFRKWNLKYANREWDWYLSGNPSAKEISNFAPIWKKHMDKNGDVRSNYGWQWNRKDSLNKVIDKLKNNKNTRQAVLSIYDSKEIDTYSKDTPCTNSIHFQIINQKLCMTVNMRSNDLWYGFCNDQYCFSKLQELVSLKLNIEIGWYYHFTSNLHLYDKNFINSQN
jgi:thymidylate synthase